MQKNMCSSASGLIKFQRSAPLNIFSSFSFSFSIFRGTCSCREQNLLTVSPVCHPEQQGYCYKNINLTTSSVSGFKVEVSDRYSVENSGADDKVFSHFYCITSWQWLNVTVYSKAVLKYNFVLCLSISNLCDFILLLYYNPVGNIVFFILHYIYLTTNYS